MTRRLLDSVGMLAVIVGAWSLMSVPTFSQSRVASAPALVVTAFGGEKPSSKFVAPKTPWGEPDLQGVWSTDDTSGIPMTRLAQYGDRLYLNDEEYAQRVKQVQRGIEQGDNE